MLVLDEPTRGVDPEREARLARAPAAPRRRAGNAARHPRSRARAARSPIGRSRSARSGERPCARRADRSALRARRALAAVAWTALAPTTQRSRSLLVALAARRGVAFAWLESGPGSASELALIGALAGIAAAGRVLFAAVPGVQPVTVIAVAAGASLGARAGMAVGRDRRARLEPLPRPGPVDAVADARLGGLRRSPARSRARSSAGACRSRSSVPCSASRSARSWISGSGSASTRTRGRRFAAVLARGVPFDVAHAIGNVVIALACGPELRRLLERYGRRLRPEVVWA